jgi:hypothetical protein
MEEKGSACWGLVGKTEAKRDFLEDGMDERLVIQIRKQGVHFQHVCCCPHKFSLYISNSLLCQTDLESMCLISVLDCQLFL